jgi:hypothetical protein
LNDSCVYGKETAFACADLPLYVETVHDSSLKPGEMAIKRKPGMFSGIRVAARVEDGDLIVAVSTRKLSPPDRKSTAYRVHSGTSSDIVYVRGERNVRLIIAVGGNRCEHAAN